MSPKSGRDDSYSDDIEIMSESHAPVASESSGNPQPFTCQLCAEDLTKYTPDERAAHYSKKHDLKPNWPASHHAKLVRKEKASYSIIKPVSQKFKELVRRHEIEEDIFWYPSQACEPPTNCSPGLITVLKHALNRSHQKGTTQRAVLCYERVVHISREGFDTGWGCGYRNFLMACTALMDQRKQTLYCSYLQDPISPGVRNLQLWIEGAWQAGYDKAGADDLGHSLCATKKFIGTAELYVAFTCRGIPSQLVDFDFRKSSKGIDKLINWVVQYFSPPAEAKQSTVDERLKGASAVVATDRMPLILQHDGHSRTIVGYEKAKNGSTNLLVFDPSILPSKKLRRVGLSALSAPPRFSSSGSRNHTIDLSGGSIGKGKRKAPSTYGNSTAKRFRSDSDDDTVTIVDDIAEDQKRNDHDASSSSGNLDPHSVVNFFRLNNNKLGKKDQYQILYFTMDDPWDERERSRRKEVTSISLLS